MSRHDAPTPAMRHRPPSRSRRRLAVLALAAAVSTLVGGSAGAGEDKPCDVPVRDCLGEMVARIEQKGWVGIEMDEDAAGRFVVLHVFPDSPAAAAGLRAGDVLLALEKVPYTRERHDELTAVYQRMRPGKAVTYTVGRGEERLAVRVVLARVPEELAAQWIGKHVLAHHAHPHPEAGDGR